MSHIVHIHAIAMLPNTCSVQWTWTIAGPLPNHNQIPPGESFYAEIPTPDKHCHELVFTQKFHHICTTQKIFCYDVCAQQSLILTWSVAGVILHESTFAWRTILDSNFPNNVTRSTWSKILFSHLISTEKEANIFWKHTITSTAKGYFGSKEVRKVTKLIPEKRWKNI